MKTDISKSKIMTWLKEHDSFSHFVVSLVMFVVVYLFTFNVWLASAFPVCFYWGREFTHNELARDENGEPLNFFLRFLPILWYTDSRRDFIYPVGAVALASLVVYNLSL